MTISLEYPAGYQAGIMCDMYASQGEIIHCPFICITVSNLLARKL